MIRTATPRDNGAIAAIWNRAVLETVATTDTEPRRAAAQRAWLARHTDDYPAIVAVEADEVVAFGALAPYRPKPSYARTVENSVYVREGWRGKGLGGLVLDQLIAMAHTRGHRSVIARITGQQRGLAGPARAARVRPRGAGAAGRLQARNLAGRRHPSADTYRLTSLTSQERSAMGPRQTLLYCVVITLFLHVVSYLLNTQLPLQIMALGGRHAQIGWLFAALTGVAMILRPQVGGWTDRYGGRAVMLPGAATLVATMVALHYATTPDRR